MDEFQIIEQVKSKYTVAKIKRNGNVLLMSLELPEERFNSTFEYCKFVEQYYKKGNYGFYYVILKFELI